MGVGGGWMWVGVVRKCPNHMCTCMHVYDIIGNSQGFPKNPMEAAICMKLSSLRCMHVRACVYMHVHMYRGTPQPPPPTPTQFPPHPPHPPTPIPQSQRDPKTPKFNKSWTNQENSPIRGWGGLSKMSKKVQNVHNWIISIRSKFIWFQWFHMSPPINPSIHP